jgi:hypothetical protein
MGRSRIGVTAGTTDGGAVNFWLLAEVPPPTGVIESGGFAIMSMEASPGAERAAAFTPNASRSAIEINPLFFKRIASRSL